MQQVNCFHGESKSSVASWYSYLVCGSKDVDANLDQIHLQYALLCIIGIGLERQTALERLVGSKTKMKKSTKKKLHTCLKLPGIQRRILDVATT